ncbi:hypothetical protein D320_22060 [Haloferax sp. BAB-2207]|nr:hypothetical protein D320_22060 [Haloferax sp. BAB-2207]
MNAPAPGTGSGSPTSGTHKYRVQNLGGPYYTTTLKGENDYSSKLRFSEQHWWTVDSTATQPSDAAQIAAIVRGLVCDSTTGLEIEYANDTDDDIDTNREMSMAVIEREVSQ